MKVWRLTLRYLYYTTNYSAIYVLYVSLTCRGILRICQELDCVLEERRLVILSRSSRQKQGKLAVAIEGCLLLPAFAYCSTLKQHQETQHASTSCKSILNDENVPYTISFTLLLGSFLQAFALRVYMLELMLAGLV